MVNRILIRIKVVQMLYAYLLTRTEFKIDTNPDTSSADKKFAYTAYVDLLLILLELTGHNTSNLSKRSSYVIDKKLATSAVGAALASDFNIKNLVLKDLHDMSAFASAIQPLHDYITDTSVYKEYRRKRKLDLGNEVELWIVLFQSAISTNPDIVRIFRSLPGFSSVGYDMAVNMVVETLKSYHDAKAGYYQALKNLEASLDKAHHLYMSIFALIVELTRIRENQIEAAKTKFLATAEEKNPNKRFVDNSFAAALAASPELAAAIKEYGISWDDDYTLLTSLLQSIVESPAYQRYMDEPTTDWNADCEFWREVLKNVVFVSDDFIDALENRSVYWNDDLQIIGTFVLKSIRQDAQGAENTVSFLPQYKDDEDARFGAELFELAVANRNTYTEYIEKFIDTANWDSDRIAFMDQIIMICAITEIINYPNIPLAVSLNEYIDIANVYSSPKSGQFVNGILYSVVRYLKDEGTIVK